MAQESLQKCYYDDDNSSEVSVYLDTKIAAEDDGKVNDNDNGLGGRNTSNPSGVIDKNLPRQNITSPENSTVETSGSTSSQVTKTGRHSEKHTLGVLGKKFFDNKIPLKRKLKWLNRLATVQDDGTVKFEVPEDIKPQSLDFGTGVVSDGATDEKDVDELENQDIPPLQIVALIVGTRGDVQPFVAIGKRLQEYGHRVRLATHSNFKEFVLASGLEYFPLGGDPKVLAEYMVKNKGFLPSEPSEIPIQRSQIKDIIFSLLPACTEPDPVSKVPFKVDAIIANPPAYGHTDVAEALKVPLHIFFTMPWTPTSEFPHPLSRVKQPVAYRLSYQIVDSMIALGMRDMINEFRKKRLKLRPVTYLSGSHSSPDFPHGYIWSRHLVPKPKALYSSRLIKLIQQILQSKPRSNRTKQDKMKQVPARSKQDLEKDEADHESTPRGFNLYFATFIGYARRLSRDWGPKIDVVGFCFLDLASSYIPQYSLVKWLEDGKKPIYIGFGSLPVREPGRMTQIIVQALEMTGQRGIINKGWGGLGNLAEPKDFVYLLDNCPHDWLFLRCAAVVHHGGAGTTAAGLKAACPATVVPFFGDQPFWGERVHARGVGPAPIPVDEFSLEKLVAAIKFMLDPEVKERAIELAKAMENEDGVAGAVKAFHKQFPREKLVAEPDELHPNSKTFSVRRCFGCTS